MYKDAFCKKPERLGTSLSKDRVPYPPPAQKAPEIIFKVFYKIDSNAFSNDCLIEQTTYIFLFINVQRCILQKTRASGDVPIKR